MKKIYTFALALIASFTFALPAIAGDDGRVTNDNVVTKKTVQDNNNGTYTLTLETYVTGEAKSTKSVVPADIVMALDFSSSMNSGLNSSTINPLIEKSLVCTVIFCDELFSINTLISTPYVL